jgi:hypothetical protein
VYTCTMWNCQFEHVERVLHDAAAERNLSSSPFSYPDSSPFPASSTPSSSSSSTTFSSSAKDNQLGTIVLTGGGNFGDLYRGETEYRNKVIQRFTNVRIVVFPQVVPLFLFLFLFLLLRLFPFLLFSFSNFFFLPACSFSSSPLFFFLHSSPSCQSLSHIVT